MKNKIISAISAGFQKILPNATPEQVATATQEVWQAIEPCIAVMGLNPDLEGLQKQVVELRTIDAAAPGYGDAQAKIKSITGRNGYEEPILIPVENLADHDVAVDGKVIKPQGKGEIYPWKLRALQRWLQPVAE